MAGDYTNPFFHRGPIRKREYFCGRTEDTGRSLSLLRNSQNVALVGQRRIGKTSLLFHIADPVIFEAHGLQQGKHLFLYLDGAELGYLSPDEVLGLLFDQLAASLPDAGQSFGLRQAPGSGLSYRSFREVILKITEAGLRPIYLIDEFESLAENPHLGPRFFSGLRALSSQFDLSFVTASRDPLLRLTYANAETLSSPFFNTFANLQLGLYPESGARGLVETLVAYARLDLPLRLIDRILELAGPHPLLLQIAAFHAVELWSEEGWQAEGAASPLAEWHRRFMAEAESHFEYYWRHLTDDDRYALATLSLSQQDEAQREAIRRLEQACLIRHAKQGDTYLSPALEEFVRRQSVLQLLQLGPFLLDLPRQAALCHDAPLKVTKTEFRALAHLIRHAGQVVTPEDLEKALWENEYVEDPERVRAVIKSLRKALGDEADCLVTKWGVGYLFQVSS
ncbi:MAG TPA: winged helix-turn-helix domain-containing protein [Anaerolineae bacterium]|nr:winged helix-turn-helix domain-containing protein [Anaerolineae bacterium]